MTRRLLLPAFFVALQAIAVVAQAQWQPDGAPVSTATGVQLNPAIVSDGAGGAIVTWEDTRIDGLADIYAQRINSGGAPLWALNGIIVCAATNPQYDPTIISDGFGGAIVAWDDSRSGASDIYVQRLNAAGVALWLANGVSICVAANSQLYPMIVPDSAGGAIVAWHDDRSGTDNIYAQRVTATGTAQWTVNGVALCTVATAVWSDRNAASIAPDGTGGAIVTWFDTRNGPVSDIYSQRVNASGAVQWAANGVPICTAPDYQDDPATLSDGIGGAFISWVDRRPATLPTDIYVQHVNASGAVQWTQDGVALCTAGYHRYNPMLAADGVGGAIISWEDDRSGDRNIYAQRVGPTGAIQWTPDGVSVCTASLPQIWPRIVSDGVGGAIVTWNDSRSGDFLYDVYAQRIDASGASLWAPDGVALSTAQEDQQYPKIIADGAGGAIVAWQDLRNGGYDIYAQRVTAGGIVLTGVRDFPPITTAWLGRNHPNPFSSRTTVDLDLSNAADVRIDVFDVTGRRVRKIDAGHIGPGSNHVIFDGLGEDGALLPSGVYFYRVTAEGKIFTDKLVIAR
jgi:FlgD Ig-like domain